MMVLLSCKSTKTSDLSGWSNASFNNAISENLVFQSLYNSPQTIFTFNDANGKDTCGVACMDENAREHSFNPSAYYRCHAIIDSDTLFIDIGSNSPWSGTGFTIQYAGGKFATKPYCWTHNNPVIPVRNDTIINQKLVLQKSNYKTGDSLFGKVSFDIIGDYQGEKKKYNRQGTFRAKVKEPYYFEVNGKKAIMDNHIH